MILIEKTSWYKKRPDIKLMDKIWRCNKDFSKYKCKVIVIYFRYYVYTISIPFTKRKITSWN